MRRFILRSIVVLMVGALGAGIGYAVGYARGQWYGFAAACDVAAAEKPANWDDWKYPNISRQFTTSTHGGGHLAGRAFRPQSCMVAATSDDFGKVVQHYAAKCGPEESRMNFGGVGLQLSGSMTNCRHLDDSARPSAGGENPPRPVSLKAFALQTGEFALTVIVSRAEGEKETHVILVHQ
ncbi:MAG: hypothetical protein ACJ8F7_14845 [Gemmataceae bacterium]